MYHQQINKKGSKMNNIFDRYSVINNITGKVGILVIKETKMYKKVFVHFTSFLEDGILIKFPKGKFVDNVIFNTLKHKYNVEVLKYS